MNRKFGFYLGPRFVTIINTCEESDYDAVRSRTNRMLDASEW